MSERCRSEGACRGARAVGHVAYSLVLTVCVASRAVSGDPQRVVAMDD